MYLGLDIGYSSLKVSFCDEGEKPQHVTLPIGVTRCDSGAGNYFSAGDGTGSPWMALTTWRGYNPT